MFDRLGRASSDLIYFSNLSQGKVKFPSAQLRSKEVATAVGGHWARFSEMMPLFLCQAAVMMPNNEMRMSMVKVAYEELGEGDSRCLHSDQFLKCVIA